MYHVHFTPLPRYLEIALLVLQELKNDLTVVCPTYGTAGSVILLMP